MFKSMFGAGKKSGKSVAQARGRAASRPQAVHENEQAKRIRSLKARNLRKAEIRAAIEQVGPFLRPDISGLVAEAKVAHKTQAPEDAQSLVHRALKLKGAAGIVDETFAHSARRYIALAIMRSLLEDRESPAFPDHSGQESPKKAGKQPK